MVHTFTFTFALMIVAIGHGPNRQVPAFANIDSFKPACPQSRYAANGNMGPLFCVVDNPAALRQFAPIAKHTFALGPNATPREVTDALVSDYKHGGTIPILCSIYRLAAWRNHWQFGIPAYQQVGAMLNFPPAWCSEPNFSDIE